MKEESKPDLPDREAGALTETPAQEQLAEVPSGAAQGNDRSGSISLGRFPSVMMGDQSPIEAVGC